MLLGFGIRRALIKYLIESAQRWQPFSLAVQGVSATGFGAKSGVGTVQTRLVPVAAVPPGHQSRQAPSWRYFPLSHEMHLFTPRSSTQQQGNIHSITMFALARSIIAPQCRKNERPRQSHSHRPPLPSQVAQLLTPAAQESGTQWYELRPSQK